MPQIDKATFFSIIQWSFVIYTGGYLLLNLSNLVTFITSVRLNAKYFSANTLVSTNDRTDKSALTSFPLAALCQ